MKIPIRSKTATKTVAKEKKQSKRKFQSTPRVHRKKSNKLKIEAIPYKHSRNMDKYFVGTPRTTKFYGPVNRKAFLTTRLKESIRTRGKHDKYEFTDTFDGESAFQYAVRCRLMGLRAVVWKKHGQTDRSIHSTYVVSVHMNEAYNNLNEKQKTQLERKEGNIRKTFNKYDKGRNKDFLRKRRRPQHNNIEKYDLSVTSDLPRRQQK